MLSKPSPKVDITKLSTGISACKEPEVPMRMMFNEVKFSFGFLVFRSILTKASSSFITISMLSGPIPVDMTVMRLPL